jgi:hypothetical protein
MTFVKHSISLPKDLYDYADKKARKSARARGHRPNFSAAVAEMVMAAKLADDKKPAKLAA